jgi:septum formation protein
MTRLILASASPRRADLLTSAGYVFLVQPAEVDETPRASEDPPDYVTRVARDKARSATLPDANSILLAADTSVVIGGRILGKPASGEEAAAMLALLSGTVHQVLTGVVVRTGTRELVELVSTRVHFRTLTASEIAWYVSSGEPAGKAGAYAIQGRAARFIDRIDGSWSNVVGLPLATVHTMLNDAGYVD